MTVAAGFFDGVHLGHQAVLEEADAAITFSNHPLSVLRPEAAPQLILPLQDKLDAMRACGVKDITVLDFTPSLAAMDAASFVRKYLSGFDTVRSAADWRFGRGGEGSPQTLALFGIKTQVLPYEATSSGKRISSSAIREALSKGDIESAAAMLGRDLAFCAKTKRGKGLGARLGRPTVNLYFGDFVPALACGVYKVELDGEKGVANFGYAPTMGDKRWKTPVMEIHLKKPPAEPFAPGTSVRVVIKSFIRPEKKFSSLEELKANIEHDTEIAFA